MDGRLNGKRAKLIVDTGAYGTLLHQHFVHRMKMPLRDTPFTSSGVNLKQLGVQLATISRFSVGSVDMRSKEVGVIDLEGLVRGGLLNGYRRWLVCSAPKSCSGITASSISASGPFMLNVESEELDFSASEIAAAVIADAELLRDRLDLQPLFDPRELLLRTVRRFPDHAIAFQLELIQKWPSASVS